ncbi:hypothetical protein JXL19_07425 [bacterium]|nr:hypothetical protein [bacterium]
MPFPIIIISSFPALSLFILYHTASALSSQYHIPSDSNLVLIAFNPSSSAVEGISEKERISKEIVAYTSGIIYVIARVNFLFDTDNEYNLTPDTICKFFGTKKSTVSSKATEIENVCKIGMGQEGLCSPQISDSLSFVQLPNGIVLSKRQAKEMGLL